MYGSPKEKSSLKSHQKHGTREPWNFDTLVLIGGRLLELESRERDESEAPRESSISSFTLNIFFLLPLLPRLPLSYLRRAPVARVSV